MMNRMAKTWAAVAVVALAVMGGLSASAAPTSSTAVLTPVGEQAFVDITTCLTSGKAKALYVYYLIDASGSLEYTDPENKRAEILQSSLQGLANFSQQGIHVEYSVAIFGTDVDPIQDWTPLDSETNFKKVVEKATSQKKGFTDWEGALKAAKRSLDSRQNSCKMMIWFTDGGIYPDGDQDSVFTSLSELCRPGITRSSLGKDGTFGFFEELRQSQISVFGVLYQNDQSTLERYIEDGASTRVAQEKLNSEHYRMSFMQPLVEGRGIVGTGDPAQTQTNPPMPPGGEITCGNVDENGFAPAGVPNGAFLNAQDPIALAFQFLKLENQIAGGAGSQIVDGTFTIRPGTSEFKIVTDAAEWTLTGPEGAVFTASSSSPGSVDVVSSAGANTLTVNTTQNPDLVGKWTFDAEAANEAQLYVYSGLTLILDRDITSQVIGNFENTLTGAVVRVEKFNGVDVDLSVFEKSQLSLEVLKEGQRVPVEGVEYELSPSGAFTISKFNPGGVSGELDLWVSVNIGEGFQPIVSKFSVSAVDSSAFAVPETDHITLSALEGPEGAAQGSIMVSGPAQGSATFCIAQPAIRTDDAQTGVDKKARDESFTWNFASTVAQDDSGCFVVPEGQNIEVAVTAQNKVQANGHVIAVFDVKSTRDDSSYTAPLQIEFDSKTQGDSAAATAVIVGLLLLGLSIPLGLLALFNRLTTKFLPMENVYRAEYPIVVTPGLTPKVLRASATGAPSRIEVGPQDFVAQTDQAASTEIATPVGASKARVPLFPLAATWYEIQSLDRSRVLTMKSGGEKNPRQFADGTSSELSPNMSENWVLSFNDSDLMAPADEDLPGRLVIFAPMSNLPQYQRLVNEATQTPGIADRVSQLRAAVSADAAKPERTSRQKRGQRDTEVAFSGTVVPSEPASVASLPGSGRLAPPGSGPEALPPAPVTPQQPSSPPLSGNLAPPAPPTF